MDHTMRTKTMKMFENIEFTRTIHVPGNITITTHSALINENIEMPNIYQIRFIPGPVNFVSTSFGLMSMFCALNSS